MRNTRFYSDFYKDYEVCFTPTNLLKLLILVPLLAAFSLSLSKLVNSSILFAGESNEIPDKLF